MNKPELMDSGKQTEKNLELLRMGEKNSHNRKQPRGWQQARTMNLEENGARNGGKTLLRSSNAENDDEKHHQELLR